MVLMNYLMHPKIILMVLFGCSKVKVIPLLNLDRLLRLGGGFFTISPAPAAGSDLYLTYEIEGEEGGDSLNSWDSANVFALAEAIDDIRLLIVSMDKAIQKRLPLSDFYKVIELVNKRLDDYEASLLSP